MGKKGRNKLNYRVSGNGHPVVFLHGFLESNTMWDYLNFKTKFKKICFDLPGHGNSPLDMEQPLTIRSMAKDVKIELDEIHVVFVPGSGCYGHNGADDAAYDAALIARAIPGKPILLKWTREDEHAWEPYGSAMVCELRASLDKDGRVVDWSHESYGDTHMGRPTPGRSGSPAEKLLSTHLQEKPLAWPIMPPTMGAHVGVHRNLEPLYNFPNPRLVKN